VLLTFTFHLISFDSIHFNTYPSPLTLRRPIILRVPHIPVAPARAPRRPAAAHLAVAEI
jgi:hypothetical protein